MNLQKHLEVASHGHKINSRKSLECLYAGDERADAKIQKTQCHVHTHTHTHTHMHKHVLSVGAEKYSMMTKETEVLKKAYCVHGLRIQDSNNINSPTNDL